MLWGILIKNNNIMSNNIKISELSEFTNNLDSFYAIGSKDGETFKYNIGNSESQVLRSSYFNGIEVFNTTKNYPQGSYILYGDKAYKFIQSHLPGSWNENEVQETNLLNEFKTIKRVIGEQKTIFKVTSDDSTLDLTGKTISINGTISGELDSTGECIIYLPENTSFVASLEEISGYKSSPSIHGKTTGEDHIIRMSYTKEVEKSDRIIDITFTVDNKSSYLIDLEGKEVILITNQSPVCVVENIKSGSVSFKFQDIALSGIIIYPDITNYTTPLNTQFTGSDTDFTIDYVYTGETRPEPVNDPITYIESTGTQYINTLIKSNIDSLKIDTVLSYSTYVQYGYFFGAWYNETSNTTRLILGSSNNDSGLCNINTKSTDGSTTILAGKLTKNTQHTIHIEKGRASVDGNSYVGPVDSGTYYSANIYLFGRNTTAAKIGMRLYSFKIYDGDTLIRDFVPWKLSDGGGCLKDNVSGMYFYNSGTGTFDIG